MPTPATAAPSAAASRTPSPGSPSFAPCSWRLRGSTVSDSSAPSRTGSSTSGCRWCLRSPCSRRSPSCGPSTPRPSRSSTASGRVDRKRKLDGMVRRVARLFKPYRGQVGLVFLSILVTGALGVAPAFLTKAIINQALLPHDLHLLWRLVVLMIAIPLVSGVIGVGQTYMTTVVGQRVMQDLRNRLYEHLQAMSLRFFTGARTGDLQSRLQNDVGGVQSVVTNTASSVLSNVVTVLSTVVAMLLLSWQLTALSFAVVPVFVFLTWRVGRARRQLSKETQESLAELSTLTEETLSVSGVLLAKTFDRQRDAIARYREGNRRLAWLQVRQQMVGRSFFALVQVFFSASPALIFLVAGYSNLSLGTIVAFTTLQTRLLFPIGSLLQTAVEVQSSLALFERIFAYLDLPHDIADAPGARELPKERVRGHVRFDDVYFRYDEPVQPAAIEAQAVEPDGDGAPPAARREWTLEDIAFDIDPGQLAAIVGPSGAGKTTISYLVPRLYDVTRGHVRIDGIDVRDIKLASLAEIVGMVTQETYLFHSSVRENLLYAKPDASQEEIEAATRAAAIHERITELSEGYDTLVGERGYRMSGGEKQRLAIAPVILKAPRN